MELGAEMVPGPAATAARPTTTDRLDCIVLVAVPYLPSLAESAACELNRHCTLFAAKSRADCDEVWCESISSRWEICPRLVPKGQVARPVNTQQNTESMDSITKMKFRPASGR